MKNLLFTGLLLISMMSNAQDVEWQYPLIKDYGAVVAMDGAIMPKEGGKVLIDLTFSGTNEDGLNRGLDRVARLINLYALAGISMDELEMAVVMHGGATPVVLSNDVFKEEYGRDNPNAELIQRLKDVGVKFMACGQALVRRGFFGEDMNPNVDLAISAITILSEYQANGWSVLYY